MKLTLERFEENLNALIVPQLSSGWDWPLSDAASLEDYMVYASKTPSLCYWVFDEVFGIKFPVGLLEFSMYTESGAPIREYSYETPEGSTVIPALMDIGVYLGKDLRGEGRAETLLHSSIQAMENMNIPFSATVHEDNARSFAFMIKATGTSGKFIREHVRNRMAHFYNFTRLKFDLYKSNAPLVERIQEDKDSILALFEG